MEWRPPQYEDSVPLILEDSHLTEDALELYCLDMLDEERDVPLVEEHLLYCEYCQKRLEKAQTFVDAAKQGAKQAQEEPPKGGSANPLRIWSIVAVAAVAAIGFVVFSPTSVRQTAAPLAFELVSLRNQNALEVPAGRPLQFRPDLAGLENSGPLRYRIVDVSGRTNSEGPLGPPPAIIEIRPLESGKYWLRVLDAQGAGTLREFSISVR